MNNKLKKVIFDYLIKEIKKVEIIYFNNSIWFIDRENRYWYFEYNKVDRHLWWRWSHFTQALKIFSMDAEKEQSIFGELVNMILTKKRKLELKYPNKIFKTVGSVMNFEDNDEVETKNEVKTTSNRWHGAQLQVDEVLNCEVKTTDGLFSNEDDRVDKVLNCEVKTTVGATDYTIPSIDDVLNFSSKSIEQDWFKSSELIDEILGSETKIKSGELIEEHEIMDKVLEIEKIDFAKGSEVYEIERALNSISSAENGADHIMDFILTDGSEIYPEEEIINKVLTQSPKLIEKQYDVDIVLNTLDIGANSIHYDVQSHEPLIDGILKKSYNL